MEIFCENTQIRQLIIDFYRFSFEKVFLTNLISTWHNLSKHCVFFADSLLIVVLGALQKELHIAPFIERFKTVALEKSY